MATAPAKKPVPLITLKHLAAEMAEKHGLTKKISQELMGDIVISISKHLKKGAKMRLTGLGTLQVRSRAARVGRNPATGEQIKIKASKKVAFRVAQELKSAI